MFPRSMRELYRPLTLLIYLKGGENDGQHSASLGDVMVITWTRNRAHRSANRVLVVMVNDYSLLLARTHSGIGQPVPATEFNRAVLQGRSTRSTVLAALLIERPLA